MTNEEREDLNTFRHDLIKRARWWQWKAETLEKENERLKAENAALRERLDKAVELPCKVEDKVYWLIRYAETPHIEEYTVNAITVKKEKNNTQIKVEFGDFYAPVVGLNNDTLFFDRAAAENQLKELRGKY